MSKETGAPNEPFVDPQTQEDWGSYNSVPEHKHRSGWEEYNRGLTDLLGDHIDRMMGIVLGLTFGAFVLLVIVLWLTGALSHLTWA